MNKQIEQLVAEGNLIGAIKLYRTEYGASLLEAKKAVEAMRDASEIGTPQPIRTDTQTVDTQTVDTQTLDTHITQTVDMQIEELLRNNRKIEAIKLYREQTGLGLAQSKKAIEEMDANIHPSKKTIEKNPKDVAPQSNPIPVDHSINGIISAQGWNIVWRETCIHNLDEGILLLETQTLRFWTLFFDTWKETFQVARKDIEGVENQKEGSTATLIIRYSGGSVRFRKIQPSSADKLQQIVTPKIRDTANHTSPNTHPISSPEDTPPNPSRQGGMNWFGLFFLIVIFWGIWTIADLVIGL